MILKILSSFILLFFLACNTSAWVPEAGEETTTIRVGAYNVRYSKNASANEIGTMLKKYNLDIIGFNEAPEGEVWTREVAKILGMEHIYVGKISSANHKDKIKSIISKTPFTSTSEFLFNEKSVGWNPASTVRVVTTINGIQISFYSLHICASELLNGHAYDLSKNILPKDEIKNQIIVGDFNNELGDPALYNLKKMGYRSTWEDIPNIDLKNDYTCIDIDKEVNKEWGIIDHIYYNSNAKIRTLNGEMITLEKPLSDHKPIWAEFEVALP